MHAVAIEGGKLVPTRMAAKPSPKAGELLIKVAYAGVNRADLMQVAGTYPPPEGASPLPGLEVSGTIEALGEDVVGWSVGEQVCALTDGGGYAQYVAVPAAQVLTIPGRVSLAEAATLPEAAATAVMALLLEANLKPGERVLIHGGASGVGLMLGQLARADGNPVYAVVGGEVKVKFLEALGIHGIDRNTGDFAEALRKHTGDTGVDVIIDILGAPALPAHLKLLNKGGRLVSLAMMDGAMVESLKIGRLLTHNLKIMGTTLRGKTPAQKAEIIRLVRKTVWPQLTTGRIRPVTDQIFPLDSAEKAHARMQSRLHMGKILLEVTPD